MSSFLRDVELHRRFEMAEKPRGSFSVDSPFRLTAGKYIGYFDIVNRCPHVLRLVSADCALFQP